MHLNSPTGTLDYTFTHTDGMDVITSASSGVTFYDQVHAADKPRLDAGQNDGIKVQAGSGGTLEVDAGAGDMTIEVNDSTTITAHDASYTGNSRIGSGVPNMKIVISDSGGTTVNVLAYQSIATQVVSNIRVETGTVGTNNTINLGGAENSSIIGAVIVAASQNNTINILQDGAVPIDADGSIFATIDSGTSAALGDGNRLKIGVDPLTAGRGINCFVTLANAPGTSSHPVVLDAIDVWDGAQLTVGHASTVGDIYLHSGAEVATTASVEAPLTVATSATTTGRFLVEGTSTHPSSASFTGASNLSTIDNFGNTTGSVNVRAGGNLKILHTSRISTFYIEDTGVATLVARTGDTLEILTVNNLTIDVGSGSSAGKLDLSNNAMIIDYTGTSPQTTVRSLLQKGYHGGLWDGNGITSSKAAAHHTDAHKTGLGYGEASVLGITSFLLHSVDSTSIVMRYAWYGDANLDGTVDTIDFNFLVNNFSQSDKFWTDGDFDYSGSIDSVDFNLLISDFSQVGIPPP